MFGSNALLSYFLFVLFFLSITSRLQLSGIKSNHEGDCKETYQLKLGFKALKNIVIFTFKHFLTASFRRERSKGPNTLDNRPM